MDQHSTRFNATRCTSNAVVIVVVICSSIFCRVGHKNQCKRWMRNRKFSWRGLMTRRSDCVCTQFLSIPCVWFECTNGDNQEEVEGHAIEITILPFSLLSLLTRKEGLHGSGGNWADCLDLYTIIHNHVAFHEQPLNHISLKKSSSWCYAKSPTVQHVSWLIPGLINCARLTWSWGLPSHLLADLIHQDHKRGCNTQAESSVGIWGGGMINTHITLISSLLNFVL